MDNHVLGARRRDWNWGIMKGKMGSWLAHWLIFSVLYYTHLRNISMAQGLALVGDKCGNVA